MIRRLEHLARRMPARLVAAPVLRPPLRWLWTQAGRPDPAPHWRKTELLLGVADRHQLDSFVETGTYRGDTTWALRRRFRQMWSIELDEDLHRRARTRFASEAHVTLLQGDSAVALPPVVAELDRPTLFWLDGHWSGGVTARGERETPVVEELRTVLTAPIRHVVLVDDARMFPEEPDGSDYPARSEIAAWVREHRPDATLRISEDIIWIEPGLASG